MFKTRNNPAPIGELHQTIEFVIYHSGSVKTEVRLTAHNISLPGTYLVKRQKKIIVLKHEKKSLYMKHQ